jgi:hypothetical protein
MVLRRGICRPSQHDEDGIKRMRAFVRDAAEILKRFPKPDTFIGRKTQEPFPQDTQITRKTTGDSHR